MSAHIVLVSAVAARGTDTDEQPIIDGLEGAGYRVSVMNWDDPAADWAAGDVTVLRSPWDYMDRFGEFQEWLDRTASVTRLLNPPEVVRWSLDKHYMDELHAGGVPVIPSVYLELGQDPVSFVDAAIEVSPQFIAKPCVGAGSRGVSSFDVAATTEHRDAAIAHVASLLHEGKAVMIQPLIDSVPLRGELPMVFFGGRFSHAANKRVNVPIGGGKVTSLFAPEDNRSFVAGAAEIAVATQAVAALPQQWGDLLYARVDLVWGNDDQPLVLEVELAEPSLFFQQSPESVPNFVHALHRFLA
jgi:glutathione synthase/RimK-type ligase-like ATP-grasp enzyme